MRKGEESGEQKREQPKAYAFLVGLGIFLSRIFGLIRERAIAHYLGAGNATGAFKAALRIPNFLQNLFGEGVLSASLIPVYAKLIAEEDEETAGRVAGAVAAFLSLIVAVFVVLGVLLSPVLVALLAPGFEGEVRELTIDLVRILFPGAGLLVMSAWCLGILNSHRKFFLSYVAPVLWNLAMIVTLIAFGTRLANFSLATALAWGTVVGSALQFGVQIPFVIRFAPKMRFALDAVLEPVREVGRNFVPVVMGRGVVQVSAFIDEIIVSFLGAPTVAILTFTHIIYMLPVSLFGMSIAASELPQMSSVLGDREEVNRVLRERLAKGLRQISFFVIPSAVAFIAIGDIIVAGVFETGEFSRSDTIFTWFLLATFALGLLPITLSRLYSSTFYALRDPKTPLKIATVRIVVAGSIAYLLALPLREEFVAILAGLGLPLIPIDPEIPATVSYGVIGVGLGTVVGGWSELMLLRRKLAQRIGAVSAALSHEMRLLGCAIAAAIGAHFLARPVVPALSDFLPSRWGIDDLGSAGVLCLVFGLIYIALTLVIGVGEARALLRRVPLVSNLAKRKEE
ncbi:MAG: murein biosynthesis integral membrane protein MurJ [Thermoanaerobaculia bacterium]|nr:murein biosynthesis integral membrane protein MurJ [Thermoanaerobaculia bacterium]